MSIKSRIIKLEKLMSVNRLSNAQIMEQYEAEMERNRGKPIETLAEKQVRYRDLLAQCDNPELNELYEDVIKAIS